MIERRMVERQKKKDGKKNEMAKKNDGKKKE